MAGLAPIEMVVLQGTPFCNLNCSYCDLSEASRKRRWQMPFSMIERVFRSIFEDRLFGPRIAVVWHSGEPLTLPPEYYRAAIELIVALRDELAPGAVSLEFDFQTNGVLISDAWTAFFDEQRHHLRLGISCDGPADMHDAFRNNWGGKPTHAKVVAGMKRLSDGGIPFKVIAVVTDKTLADPDGFFDFFLERSPHLSGFHFNILADGELAGQDGLVYSRQDRDRYYDFYRHLLDRERSVIEAGGAFRLQNFSQALSRILTKGQDTVVEASRPLRTINVDAKGYVTSFYAGLEKSAFPDQYGDGDGLSLGNIEQHSIAEMIAGPKFASILSDFQTSQSSCRASCGYFGLCSGGFELSKLSEHGRYEAAETAECAIIVKALVDAVLDDMAEAAPHEKAV